MIFYFYLFLLGYKEFYEILKYSVRDINNNITVVYPIINHHLCCTIMPNARGGWSFSSKRKAGKKRCTGHSVSQVRT
jgi:hypothetical protein